MQKKETLKEKKIDFHFLVLNKKYSKLLSSHNVATLVVKIFNCFLTSMSTMMLVSLDHWCIMI